MIKYVFLTLLIYKFTVFECIQEQKLPSSFTYFICRKKMQVWDQDFVFGDDKNICVLSHKSAPS